MAKSKYDRQVAPFLDNIRRWAQKGATQAEIAQKLQLGQSTFQRYLARGERGEQPFSDLTACFRQAVQVPDDQVEAALFKSALGHCLEVAKNYKLKEIHYDPQTGKKVSEIEKLVVGYDQVHVSPSVTAQMFWLANRRAGRWRYKPEPREEGEETGGGVVELPAVLETPQPPQEVQQDG